MVINNHGKKVQKSNKVQMYLKSADSANKSPTKSNILIKCKQSNKVQKNSPKVMKVQSEFDEKGTNLHMTVQINKEKCTCNVIERHPLHPITITIRGAPLISPNLSPQLETPYGSNQALV